MLGAQNANAMWGLVIAIPAVGLGVLAVLLWLGARERRTTESELTALRSMSSTEAEQQALLLLARHEMFQTHPATQQINHPDLPSHVNALSNRYDEIVRGEFWIGTAALTQPARLPGFIKIGEDFEFTEILVRPGDQKIYISYGEGPPSSSTLETEETIWHEILIASGVQLTGA